MSYYKNSAYKAKVKFKKTFHRGALKGMTVDDEIHHVDHHHAKSWVKDMQNSKSIAGHKRRGFYAHDFSIVDTKTGKPLDEVSIDYLGKYNDASRRYLDSTGYDKKTSHRFRGLHNAAKLMIKKTGKTAMDRAKEEIQKAYTPETEKKRKEHNMNVYKNAVEKKPEIEANRQILLRALEKAKQLSNEETLIEKYVGFKRLQRKLEDEGKSEKAAGAIAASIGRKKWGTKKFNLAAKEHHTLRNEEIIKEK